MSYALAMRTCPHCDMLVIFSHNEICPSCHINCNEPVTQADLERITRLKKSDLAKKNLSKDKNSNAWDYNDPRMIFLFLRFFRLIFLFR